ncbi:MAG TPA: GNAT family N-acetyltransferase [Chloroflexia bacterium]|nr:GNAT family N-acetyltransferase [Chloroflexia bacterium]
MTTATGQVCSREYLDRTDFKLVNDFLTESYLLLGKQHNWSRVQWEILHTISLNETRISRNMALERRVRLWETNQGKVVGMVNFEDREDFFIQIHPQFRFLENEMLEWAEEHFAAFLGTDPNNYPLYTYVYGYDVERARTLTHRGYQNLCPVVFNRWRAVDKSFTRQKLAPKYGISGFCSSVENFEKLAQLDLEVFGSAHLPVRTIRVLREAPSYRPDLDLVVVSPAGLFVAFCLAWFDPATRTGELITLGTHPDYRRQGLGSKLIAESLIRLGKLGAKVVYVNTAFNSASNLLYEAMGFDQYATAYRWSNELSGRFSLYRQELSGRNN